MEIRVIQDRDVVYEFLKDKNRYNYLYQFYSLSEEQWKNVICYGLFEQSHLKEIAMIMSQYDIPVLLAAGFENEKYSAELVKAIKEILPRKFYTHIDRLTLDKVFLNDSISELEGYMNMGLTDYDVLDAQHMGSSKRIGFEAIEAIKALIAVSYPEAWLDDELVKLNKNFGIYVDEELVSFAGIHAYSEQYQVAAVAHVTTNPSYRKKGYGKEVTAALSKSLREKIKFIGLNVRIDNSQAIGCYKKLGYREFGKFAACEIEIK